MHIEAKRAAIAQSGEITVMVGELLTEIMISTGVKAFNFDPEETEIRLRAFLKDEKYVVFLAVRAGEEMGFVALYESFALYAEGAFGTIAELYVRPQFRSEGVGKLLVEKAIEFAASRSWTRLEVTTPPLPQFQRTLGFYERVGFSISGGRKLKIDV